MKNVEKIKCKAYLKVTGQTVDIKSIDFEYKTINYRDPETNKIMLAGFENIKLILEFKEDKNEGL